MACQFPVHEAVTTTIVVNHPALVSGEHIPKLSAETDAQSQQQDGKGSFRSGEKTGTFHHGGRSFQLKTAAAWEGRARGVTT